MGDVIREVLCWPEWCEAGHVTISEIEEIVKLLSQPKKVSREWVEKKADNLVWRFHAECHLTNLQKMGIKTVLAEKGDLEDMLSELGIEVEK